VKPLICYETLQRAFDQDRIFGTAAPTNFNLHSQLPHYCLQLAYPIQAPKVSISESHVHFSGPWIVPQNSVCVCGFCMTPSTKELSPQSCKRLISLEAKNCFLRGTDCILKCFLSELRLRRANHIQAQWQCG
jgi:hypothetical protein